LTHSRLVISHANVVCGFCTENTDWNKPDWPVDELVFTLVYLRTYESLRCAGTKQERAVWFTYVKVEVICA
jgi:hypothetical protein